MRIAIYCRVSDDKLKDDGTRRQDVNRQIDDIKKFLIEKEQVQEQDIVVYSDDGKSAWTDDLNSRPAFAQMRRDMLRHLFNKVYIESIDRFSSNLGMGIIWLTEYGKGNCHVISLHDGEYETTSDEGWQKSAIMLMFAEIRIRNQRRKTVSGMQRRVEKNVLCPSCNKVHLGRHPLTCQCDGCKYRQRLREKRGGQIAREQKHENIGSYER